MSADRWPHRLHVLYGALHTPIECMDASVDYKPHGAHHLLKDSGDDVPQYRSGRFDVQRIFGLGRRGPPDPPKLAGTGPQKYARTVLGHR